MPLPFDHPRRAKTDPTHPITCQDKDLRHSARKPASLPIYRAVQATGAHSGGRQPPWSAVNPELSYGDTETDSEISVTGTNIPSIVESTPASFGLRRWLEESDPVQRILDARHRHRPSPSRVNGPGNPDIRPSTPSRLATWHSAVKGSPPIQFGKRVVDSTGSGQNPNMVSIGSFSDDIDG